MSTKPQFQLKALNKITGEKSQSLGGGWLNPNGSISIKLNMCVVLPNTPEMVFTLFPAEWGTNPLSEAVVKIEVSEKVKELIQKTYSGTTKGEVLMIACPECDAQPGDCCLGVQNQPRKSFHSKRWHAHAMLNKRKT